MEFLENMGIDPTEIKVKKLYVKLTKDKYIDTINYDDLCNYDVIVDAFEIKEELTYYKYDESNNNFFIDKNKKEQTIKENEFFELRQCRETECFSVINRGELWYKNLTDEQYEILQTWYKSWLDVTTTLVIPEIPEFL